MDPNIRTPDIHAVETAPVTASNGHVICLPVGDSRHDEVEHGRINKDDIMHREIRRLLNA